MRHPTEGETDRSETNLGAFQLAEIETRSEGSRTVIRRPPRQPFRLSPEAHLGADLLLGTVPYMSPEQARGQDLDERSDIWSFGCVLWECLTGKRLFDGATMSDSIAAILHKEPEWHQLPAASPASMHRLLRRCLAKDPHDRLHHMADARLELDEWDSTPPVQAATTRHHTSLPIVRTPTSVVRTQIPR